MGTHRGRRSTSRRRRSTAAANAGRASYAASKSRQQGGTPWKEALEKAKKKAKAKQLADAKKKKSPATKKALVVKIGMADVKEVKGKKKSPATSRLAKRGARGKGISEGLRGFASGRKKQTRAAASSSGGGSASSPKKRSGGGSPRARMAKAKKVAREKKYAAGPIKGREKREEKRARRQDSRTTRKKWRQEQRASKPRKKDFQGSRKEFRKSRKAWRKAKKQSRRDRNKSIRAQRKAARKGQDWQKAGAQPTAGLGNALAAQQGGGPGALPPGGAAVQSGGYSPPSAPSSPGFATPGGFAARMRLGSNSQTSPTTFRGKAQDTWNNMNKLKDKKSPASKYMGFGKLEGSLKKKGYNKEAAGAIAASIGRKKYGAKKFNSAAGKGKKLGKK